MGRSLDRLFALAGVALVLVTVVVALSADRRSGAHAAAPSTQVASSGQLAIKGFAFMPASVIVKAGTRVTWLNNDNAEHTATADAGGAFDSGTMQKGQSKSVTLSKPGTYAYHCDFHPFMKASVTVR